MRKSESTEYEPIGDLMILGVPARTLTSKEFEQYAEVHGRDVMLKAFRPVRSFNNVKKEDSDGSLRSETLTTR